MKIQVSGLRGGRLVGRRGGEQVDHVDDQAVMSSWYVLAHVSFNFATILAIRTLESWLHAALVSQMSVQVSLPIKRFGAIRTWTNVNRVAQFRRSAFRRSTNFPVRPPTLLGI